MATRVNLVMRWAEMYVIPTIGFGFSVAGGECVKLGKCACLFSLILL